MNDKELLAELEEDFFKTLNNKLFSFEIKRANDYVDIACITAVKTNKTKMVYFDFTHGVISFWNDFDEEFFRELTKRGVAELADIFKREINQVYYMNVLKGGRNVAVLPEKNCEISDENIMKTFNKIYQCIKEKFDVILVDDFSGAVNKKIIYDEGLSKYICVDNGCNLL